MLAFGSAKSTHIVGGEITYECLGGDFYRITLIIYRDCLNGSAGAPLDDPAFLTIRNNSGVFLRLDMPLADTSFIPSDINDPCFQVPSGVCVSRGYYFLDRVYLPQVAGGYTLTYQRCCRNHSIRNILNPKDYGSTVTTNIPDPGLTTCNSSPYFVNRPPLAICLGSEFVFDHSALDRDGDSLTYEFCDPLHGGGSGGGGSPGSVNGPRPDTASAPPYSPIVWAGGYSASDPIDGNPKFSIDLKTGRITGFPNRLGNYVFGVCVKEYRNGKLVGLTRREYQVNVVMCLSNTQAKFELPDPCGGLTVSFSNTSITSRTFLWDFGLAASTSDTSEDRIPTFTFPDTGTYNVTLIANRQFKCADTIQRSIRVFPSLSAEILPIESKCVSNPIFNFNVEGVFQPYTNLEWSMPDGKPSTSNSLNPSGIIMPAEEGYYKVSFTASHGPCKVTKTNEALVAPHPVLKYAIRSNDGCAPLKLQLEDYSTAWTKVHRLWQIDELTLTDSLVQRIYERPGIYVVGLSVYTKEGCIDTIPPVYKTFKVNPSPSSGFSLTETELSIFQPTTEMIDRSLGADECIAYFGEEKTTRNCNDQHSFTKPGIFRVSQLVKNEYGCTDTSSKLVEVKNEYAFFIPNSFTPNNDGRNEVFKPVVVGAKEYVFTVLDRWGHIVFQSENSDEGWDGTEQNRGRPSPIGMYLYQAEVRNFLDEIKKYRGEFQLIR